MAPRFVHVFNEGWLKPVCVQGVWIAPRAIGHIPIAVEGQVLVIPAKVRVLGVDSSEPDEVVNA
jgi:hypothetical protein